MDSCPRVQHVTKSGITKCVKDELMFIFTSQYFVVLGKHVELKCEISPMAILSLPIASEVMTFVSCFLVNIFIVLSQSLEACY